MAFADVLLHETDADILLVDEHHKPGGHWNDAYPFVTLHQPSAFYGVSSKELSRGALDQVGLNQGLGDLASGAEVSAYFDQVMNQTFLPSGRVRFYSMCRYEGEGRFRSIVSGQAFQVTARRKVVDATFLKTTVPSTHTPSFSVDPEAWFMPLNDLPRMGRTPAGYVIVGAGKTGIDACLWLLQQGADPDTITWIMPRDAWLLDRRNTQPTEPFFNDAVGTQAAQFEAIVNSTSIPDMFDRLEAAGYFLRIDPKVRPSMFHGATTSALELEQMRRIKTIVRMGRVTAIEKHRIVLEQGEIPTSPDHLHVDCSARAITNERIVPIFQGNLITPQMVRSYQPVFSAAFIAHIEAAYDDEAEKNRLCGVVPLPNHDTDYLRFTAAFMMNQYNWSQVPELQQWLLNNRLDGFSTMIDGVDPDDAEKMAILKRISTTAPAAVGKLFDYIQQLDAEQTA
ncbi:MAG: NAD(P)/FAD-dependent oxidoreductase [Pseudomonadota bacterium]